MFMITGKDRTGAAGRVRINRTGLSLLPMNGRSEHPTVFVRREDAEAAVRTIAVVSRMLNEPRGIRISESGMQVAEAVCVWQSGPAVIAIWRFRDGGEAAQGRSFVRIRKDGAVVRVQSEAQAALFADACGAEGMKEYLRGRVKTAKRDEYLQVRRAGRPQA